MHDVLNGTSCANRIWHGHSQWEPKLELLDAYADGDWAAMETERKSSSCVVIRLGQLVLETSPTTQGVISLSSGEAESYAASRVAACGIQLQQFFT